MPNESQAEGLFTDENVWQSSWGAYGWSQFCMAKCMKTAGTPRWRQHGQKQARNDLFRELGCIFHSVLKSTCTWTTGLLAIWSKVFNGKKSVAFHLSVATALILHDLLLSDRKKIHSSILCLLLVCISLLPLLPLLFLCCLSPSLSPVLSPSLPIPSICEAAWLQRKHSKVTVKDV